MASKHTAPSVFAMKASGQKVVCLTAYDFFSGLVAERAGVDLVLVGDSIGNVVFGEETTLGVELDDIVRATRSVKRAVKEPLLVADLPFGSYHLGPAQAVESSVALMKAGAEAVKLEGALLEEIEAVRRAGIPVMGHVGFTPQSVHAFGGFRVQGKSDPQAVIDAAIALDEIGVFSIVLELIPAELAKEISSKVTCPTIGIGAGVHCDGQIQVFHDVLGMAEKTHKHAKRYAQGLEIFQQAISNYSDEVRNSVFPTVENSF
jgi:3-methyl-2-oxobutanoate hydroxymethyltransferase